MAVVNYESWRERNPDAGPEEAWIAAVNAYMLYQMQHTVEAARSQAIKGYHTLGYAGTDEELCADVDKQLEPARKGLEDIATQLLAKGIIGNNELGPA